MQNLFDASDISENDNSHIRTGYSITVLHPSGYAQIANYYFEKEGLQQPINALERKTLGQMKTFCEKQAHKTGELIQSKYLKYEETYKAVAKATA